MPNPQSETGHVSSTLTASVTHPPLLKTLSVWIASEAMAKVTRLGAIIIAARVLTPADLGLVALVLAFGEILKAMTDNGCGQKIIAARDKDLAATCNTAHRLFKLWCGVLFSIGCAIAAIFHFYLGQSETALLLVVYVSHFLIMPVGLVPCFLAMRNGKSRTVAAITGGQVVLSALLSVFLLLIWPVPAALILPRLLTAPAWAFAMRYIQPWQADTSAGTMPVMPFIRFGSAVIGVEMTKSLRLQADKLIIGGILGMEALGIWFFAVNAGLGLASSFANALAFALFPSLCAKTGKDRREHLKSALKTALFVLAPIVLAQAFLAPVYVPLVFGANWSAMTNLVSILCLAAIPAIIWAAIAQWLRAEDRAGDEFRISLIATILLTAALAASASSGLQIAAFTYLAAATLTQGGAAFLILKNSR